jgi:hypothetical protein
LRRLPFRMEVALLITDDLLLLVGVVYASVVAGLVVLWKTPRLIQDVSFKVLGEVLKTRFPDLPAGFTLREGLARARQEEPGLDWNGIDEALASYENQRYGGLPEQGAPKLALESLIMALRRRGS